MNTIFIHSTFGVDIDFQLFAGYWRVVYGFIVMNLLNRYQLWPFENSASYSKTNERTKHVYGSSSSNKSYSWCSKTDIVKEIDLANQSTIHTPIKVHVTLSKSINMYVYK